MPSPGRSEMVARLTAMYQELSAKEKADFLDSNHLKVSEDPAAKSPSATPKGRSDVQMLVVSSAHEPGLPSPSGALVVRDGSPRVGVTFDRNRSAEALRLIADDNSILQRVEPHPLLNVSGVRFTDDDLRAWFDALDVNKNGFLSKDEFRAMYEQVETFGTPVRKNWMEEQLRKIKKTGDTITREEFALLVSHVATM